jgi:hypothetical protein
MGGCNFFHGCVLLVSVLPLALPKTQGFDPLAPASYPVAPPSCKGKELGATRQPDPAPSRA